MHRNPMIFTHFHLKHKKSFRSTHTHLGARFKREIERQKMSNGRTGTGFDFVAFVSYLAVPASAPSAGPQYTCLPRLRRIA